MKISKPLLLAGGLFIFFGNLPCANGGVQFTTLFAFNGTNGDSPEQIVQGVDGALYGTTYSGGIGWDGTGFSGNGTVFRLALDGSFTNTVLFNVTNGLWGGSLIRGQDNNLYGMTFGNFTGGTVFKLGPDGNMLNPGMITFYYTNGVTPIRLTQDPEGILFGSTQFGGTESGTDGSPGFDIGTVFELSTNGTYTSFSTDFWTTNGLEVISAIHGIDGNIYGTTLLGGTSYTGSENNLQGDGTLFRMGQDGSLITLLNFNGTNGDNPLWLLQGTDGFLYGTTSDPFITDGTVFKASTNGDLVWSFSFDGTNGSQPGFLMQANDGNLYGTAGAGGAGYGVVYRITPDGAFTQLMAFGPTNSEPGFITQGIDNDFYGTTSFDYTSSNRGTIFRLSVPMPPVIQGINQTNGLLGLSWRAVAGQQYQLQYNTDLTTTNWNNLGGLVLATNGTLCASDPIGTDPQRFYRVLLSP